MVFTNDAPLQCNPEDVAARIGHISLTIKIPELFGAKYLVVWGHGVGSSVLCQNNQDQSVAHALVKLGRASTKFHIVIGRLIDDAFALQKSWPAAICRQERDYPLFAHG